MQKSNHNHWLSHSELSQFSQLFSTFSQLLSTFSMFLNFSQLCSTFHTQLSSFSQFSQVEVDKVEKIVKKVHWTWKSQRFHATSRVCWSTWTIWHTMSQESLLSLDLCFQRQKDNWLRMLELCCSLLWPSAGHGKEEVRMVFQSDPLSPHLLILGSAVRKELWESKRQLCLSVTWFQLMNWILNHFWCLSFHGRINAWKSNWLVANGRQTFQWGTFQLG